MPDLNHLTELQWQLDSTPIVRPHPSGNGIVVGTDETHLQHITDARGSMIALAAIAAHLRTLTEAYLTSARSLETPVH